MPLAMLVPVGKSDQEAKHEAIEALRTFRKGRTLGGLSIREMIDEGKRPLA